MMQNPISIFLSAKSTEEARAQKVITAAAVVIGAYVAVK